MSTADLLPNILPSVDNIKGLSFRNTCWIRVFVGSHPNHECVTQLLCTMICRLVGGTNLRSNKKNETKPILTIALYVIHPGRAAVRPRPSIKLQAVVAYSAKIWPEDLM